LTLPLASSVCRWTGRKPRPLACRFKTPMTPCKRCSDHCLPANTTSTAGSGRLYFKRKRNIELTQGLLEASMFVVAQIKWCRCLRSSLRVTVLDRISSNASTTFCRFESMETQRADSVPDKQLRSWKRWRTKFCQTDILFNGPAKRWRKRNQAHLRFSYLF